MRYEFEAVQKPPAGYSKQTIVISLIPDVFVGGRFGHVHALSTFKTSPEAVSLGFKLGEIDGVVNVNRDMLAEIAHMLGGSVTWGGGARMDGEIATPPDPTRKLKTGRFFQPE